MDRLPPPCAGGCGRPVRPVGSSKEEWPGTKVVMARGMCGSCYKKTPDRVNVRRPDNCVDCERPLRPNNALAKDWPGTVRNAAKGKCDSCLRGHSPRSQPPKLDPCKECGVKLRYKGSAPEPGTKVHEGHGLCTTCRGRQRRGTTAYSTKATPVACVSCESALRPRHSARDQYPGAKEHAGKGLCRSCESSIRRGRLDPSGLPAPVYPEIVTREVVTHEVTDPALLRLLNARKERHARQEQQKRLRIAQEAARARFIQTRNAA